MSASPIPDSACRNCGEELAPGARFCSSCGTATSDLPPVETVAGPVVHESVDRRWLGLPARFVLLCLGFGAFGAAIGLFATGSWAWGIVMLLLGSGPIKGFAVVLLIGIITSVFTAVTFTRMLTAGWIKRHRPTEIHI